ncbi:hypothetical protein CEXT_245491 [Caerostris extrusa]|uniref:Uncharacterized protein n=1 Tax=Caerostris extrusa TaxID=172846 RepID=A0AAV4Y937_CAEEX|nr:hypothetical protein CEXT_245491 [Caerostris extrusa]
MLVRLENTQQIKKTAKLFSQKKPKPSHPEKGDRYILFNHFGTKRSAQSKREKRDNNPKSTNAWSKLLFSISIAELPRVTTICSKGILDLKFCVPLHGRKIKTQDSLAARRHAKPVLGDLLPC